MQSWSLWWVVGTPRTPPAPTRASYRTVAAITGDVQETLSVSGTVEPVGRADLSFATSGTIATIGVEAGDRVRRGQILGTLETTGLRNAVSKARSTLASARAHSSRTRTPRVDGGLGVVVEQPRPRRRRRPRRPDATESIPSETPTDTPTRSGGDSDALGEALAQLADEQDAVTGAQSTVSASLAAATDALTAQQAACATAFGTDDGTDESGSTDDANAACTTALATVQTAQTQVATDQQTLQDALEALAGTLTDAVAALQSVAVLR